MKAERIILSRGLPKTGQEIEYNAGDDGTHEAGWWRGLKVIGNKVRFVSKTIEGDNVVIDKATGLMWVTDGFAYDEGEGDGLLWAAAISYANSLDFAGFTDWRLSNVMELISLARYNDTDYRYYWEYFSNIYGYRWSSTTFGPNSIYAYRVAITSGTIGTISKTVGVFHVLPVRGGL